MRLKGTSLVGAHRTTATGQAFHAVNPASGARLEPAFFSATSTDVETSARFASDAFATYGRLSGAVKAEFLRRIAEELESGGDGITQRAQQETGLPLPRLQSELGRTCHQLRLFAALVEEGSWVDARIDHADPQRTPLPKPDIRSMLRPLGPVAVFGSSNFPLAFSVAGGDTASALAAGCPVIVKAHPAHPGTSELVGVLIQQVVGQLALQEGVFSLLFDAGHDVGAALVRDPHVKAVAFTGSRRGGLALSSLIASRAEPIPLFAEMGSINPVVVLPEALATAHESIASGLHASVTLGLGQFCTNPGLVFLIDGAGVAAFLETLKRLFSHTLPGVMLTEGIAAAYRKGTEMFARTAGVQTVLRVAPVSGNMACSPALFATTADVFIAQPHLMNEVFGPSTLVIRCRDGYELNRALSILEGQLTATLHGTDADCKAHPVVMQLLENKAGRIIRNGFPTGVEVCHAMVHGGPFPATSDGRSTSVGTRAIERFTRPVCYQNLPEEFLPDELKEGNPLGITRLVDGRMMR